MYYFVTIRMYFLIYQLCIMS